MDQERRYRLSCALGGLFFAAIFLGGWFYARMEPETLEQWLRHGMGPVESAAKNFISIVANLNDSILSSGIYLLAGSLFILSAGRLKKRAFPGRACNTT